MTMPIRLKRIMPLAAVVMLAAINGGAATEQPAAEMKAKARALVQACHADYQHFCADVQPGGGRVLACLGTHSADLTQGCRDVLPAAEALKTRASQAGVLPN
jgi:hypothetical protein